MERVKIHKKLKETKYSSKTLIHKSGLRTKQSMLRSNIRNTRQLKTNQILVFTYVV